MSSKITSTVSRREILNVAKDKIMKITRSIDGIRLVHFLSLSGESLVGVPSSEPRPTSAIRIFLESKHLTACCHYSVGLTLVWSFVACVFLLKHNYWTSGRILGYNNYFVSNYYTSRLNVVDALKSRRRMRIEFVDVGKGTSRRNLKVGGKKVEKYFHFPSLLAIARKVTLDALAISAVVTFWSESSLIRSLNSWLDVANRDVDGIPLRY